MFCKSAMAVMVTTVLLAASVAKAGDWLTYQNDRYGTTIDYPPVFAMQPPPDADDGRAFKSADGADFTVSASYGGIDYTLSTYRAFIVKNLPAGSAVTYGTQGKNWFVISGTRGDNIFYEKHLLSHGGEMTEDFAMSYPATLKETYDPIVARIAKSLRSGRGFQSP